MGTSKKSANIPSEKLELYDKAAAGHKEFERKGDTVPYTSFNGHMFSFMSHEGTLVIRLPEKDRLEFVKKYQTQPVIAYGALMKEYVEVPELLLKDTKELKRYLERGFEYVKQMKPKPTKKAKTKK